MKRLNKNLLIVQKFIPQLNEANTFPAYFSKPNINNPAANASAQFNLYGLPKFT